MPDVRSLFHNLGPSGPDDLDRPAGMKRAGDAAPPWQSSPGQPPPRSQPAPMPTPWEQQQGPAPRPPSARLALSPLWDSAPSVRPSPVDHRAADETDLTDMRSSLLSAQSDEDLFDLDDWQAREEDELPAELTAEDELLHGLPWMSADDTDQPSPPPSRPSVTQMAGLSDEPITMDSLLAEYQDEPREPEPPPKPPSLRDRLKSLSPTPPPPGDDVTGPGEPEQAAEDKISAAPVEIPIDLDWLEEIEAPAEAEDAEAAPPALPAEEPALALGSELASWIDDDLFDIPEQPAGEEAAPGAVPDWLTAASEEALEEEFDEEDEEAMPWLAPDALEKEPAEPAQAPEEPEEAVPGWLTAAAEELEEDEEDEEEMPWLAPDAFEKDFEEELAQPDEEEAVPGWLAAAEIEPDEEEAEAPIAAAEQEMSEEVIPGWLESAAEAIEELEEEAEVLPEEEAELPGWVLHEEEPAPGVRGIRRIGDMDSGEPEATLSYEEWEQREEERIREAQKTDEDRLLEEVPEWFDRLESEEAPAPPETGPSQEAAQPGGPDFIPDWYLGLEEQDTDEAPDWFQQIDYSGQGIVSPLAEPTPPPAPEPTASDVPDWFMGLGAPSAGEVDWATAFSAPQAEERPPDEEPPIDWLAGGEEAQEFPLPDTGMLVPGGADSQPPPPPPGVMADFLEPEEEEPASAPNLFDDLFPPSGEEEPSAEESLTFEDLPLPDTGFLTGGVPGDMEEPEAEMGEMPDWLASVAPGGRLVAEPEEIPFPDLDLDQPMPDEWAAETAPQAGDFVERFEPLEPEEPAVPAEEMPDWLRDMGDVEQAPDLITPPPELPLQMDEAAAEDALSPYIPEAESMDWLEGLSPEDVALSDQFEPEPDQALLEALPPAQPTEAPQEDWLRADTLDSGGIDDLLSLYEPQAEIEPDVGELGEAVAPDLAEAQEQDLAAMFGVSEADQELPDLETMFGSLEMPAGEEAHITPELLTPSGEPEQAVEPKPDEAEDIDLEAAPRPEWLAEVRPTELPVIVKAGPASTSIRQRQVAELPDRVRVLHDTVSEGLAGEEQEPVAPEGGPLAGITGALPVTELLVESALAPTPSRLEATPEQLRRAEKLHALLESSAEESRDAGPIDLGSGLVIEDGVIIETAPKTAGKKRRRRSRRFKPDRLLATLVLLAALGAPFASDALHLADDPPPLNKDGVAVTEAVNNLLPGDYVLVAFEYAPAAAPELDPLVQALLRDIFAREAIPLTISTSPAGAFHAHSVIEPLVDTPKLLAVRAQNEEELTFGEDYYVLSYLPGEMIGVRSLRNITYDEDDQLKEHLAFRRDIEGDKTGLPIGDVEASLALIVVVGESTEDVRTWAEQLNGLEVPKVALVTAAIEPLVTAYVNQDAYTGYLAGFRDTYSYNKTRNANTYQPYTMPENVDIDIPNPDQARWHSMALGAAAAAGLITFGMVINLFRALFRRRRRR